jgi:penicillin-binding protein 2
MDGILYRPHVVAASQLPPQDNKPAQEAAPVRVQIDPQNWITITDAMAAVLTPGGTASSAHLQGIDFAGKTGTAQLVSHDFRKANQGKVDSSFNDNVWFAGVAPRRNPEIIVVVLLEHGLNSAIAARTASQVIKVYVEKQRHIRNDQMLFSDKVDPGAVPVAGLWNEPSELP